MWLIKPPEYTIPVLVVHPERIEERLREGWRECPDPTAQETPPAPAPTREDGRTARGDIPLHSAPAVRHTTTAAKKGRR